MPPSCLCPKLTWGADVASACCSLHDKGEPGSPCPSRPVLRIIGSLLLLLASGFFLSAWWCTLPCARVYIYIYIFFSIYVFCARDLVQIEACPAWLWESFLAAGSRPKQEAVEGVEQGSQPWIGFWLFALFLDLICAAFISVLRWTYNTPGPWSLRADRGVPPKRRHGGTDWQSFGFGPQEFAERPCAKCFKDGPMRAWTFPILYFTILN